MAVTIKDVARLAEVSISTVSRVINDSKPVSPEVRKKVLKIIEEIGYKPNEIARSLVTKKSFLIGVIISDIGHSYVAEMVRGIEEIGKMYNYDILLCSSYGDTIAQKKYIQLLNSKQVAGIVIIGEQLIKEVEADIKTLEIPFVYLSRNSISKGTPSVQVDNYEASYEMTNYLLSLGHRNIAFIGDIKEENTMELQKLNGYKDALYEYEDAKENVIKVKDSSYEKGYNAGVELLKKIGDVTAVICSKDEIAVGLINYLNDNNIVVPDDISVTGFGDYKIASLIRPKLTTIKEPFYDIGAVAIRRIIKEIKGEKSQDEIIKLPFQIQKRGSCKKL
ncbi:LacI family DNA-binding transcriptional regulator [Clostridiaceae bacterium M8S5]|nr:LacI family DNA-binding transcriptional regulator [Clostridiaceae bacterium M8S5]